MPLVVTGAAGFIGSRLAHALLPLVGAEDLVLVDHPLSGAKTGNLRGLEAVRFQTHTEFLADFEADPTPYPMIFHLGACSDTTEDDWEFLLENNLRYSQRLFEGCVEAQTRLLYASSAATYGDGSRGFDDECDLERLEPLNLYGRSKHEFDLWAEKQEKRPTQCVGLKFFNVWGPGESHKGRMASMAFHAFLQIETTQKVRLFRSDRPDFPDGGQKRDFIYVGDIVSLMLQFWRKPEISGLFNAGTGKAATFLEFVSAMFAALSREPKIEWIAMPEDLRGKYQYFTEAKMEKIRRAGIEFTPMPLREAMQEYAAFLKAP